MTWQYVGLDVGGIFIMNLNAVINRIVVWQQASLIETPFCGHIAQKFGCTFC